MPRRFDNGGFMSYRIAERIVAMALIVGSELFVEPGFEFIETLGELLVRGKELAQARTISMPMALVRGDFRTLAAWIAPCSVNA